MKREFINASEEGSYYYNSNFLLQYFNSSAKATVKSVIHNSRIDKKCPIVHKVLSKNWSEDSVVLLCSW